MNKLAAEIKKLIGDKTLESVVQKSGLSRQIFYDIKDSGRVKLDTLLKITAAAEATRVQRNEIVKVWLEMQLGPELRRWFIIQQRFERK